MLFFHGPYASAILLSHNFVTEQQQTVRTPSCTSWRKKTLPVNRYFNPRTPEALQSMEALRKLEMLKVKYHGWETLIKNYFLRSRKGGWRWRRRRLRKRLRPRKEL